MRHPHPAKWNSYLGVSALLICVLFLLPLLTVTMIRSRSGEEPEETVELLPPGEVDSAETVRVLLDGTVETLPLSDYLTGVVRAEMPASFEFDALCAQAVAARTYTYYKMASGGNHGDTADVCGDSTCCQAYLSRERAAANWGDKAQNYEAKIENAVAATDAQTLLYGGTPILAVFHSSSASQTKSAGEVWTQDLPYLQSVSSPEQGEAIPNYYSRVEYTAEEFRERFLASHPEAKLSGGTEGWITEVRLSEGTNVESVTIGGVTIRGGEARTIFSLRSASFEVEAQSGKILFYVTGYGHGVGMSQYGANQMAAQGSSWREILEHYYTGVTIASYSLKAKSAAG